MRRRRPKSWNAPDMEAAIEIANECPNKNGMKIYESVPMETFNNVGIFILHKSPYLVRPEGLEPPTF